MRYRLVGVAAILTMALLAAGTVAAFNQVFTPSVDAVVHTGRSGLLMDPGGDVTLHGIVVGKVRKVASDGQGATLDVALDPDHVPQIPQNVSASITSPTVFGAKFVQLDVPAVASVARVTNGTVINATQVTTEVQTVLGELHTLLTHVDVAELNSALGALSTSLNGRGDQLGDLLVRASNYLEQLNPSLRPLGHDLDLAAGVANNLADASPDLLTVLDSLSTTSDTLVEEKPAIAELFTDIVTASDTTRDFLDENGQPITQTLSTLRPTSAFLARYAPMFPCLLSSLNTLRRDLEPVIGGQLPGIHTFSSFLPGSQGYQNPQDLPKIDPSVGPTCFNGPIDLRPGDKPIPHVVFDDGTTSYDRRSDTVTPGTDPLPILLFGDVVKGAG